MKYNKLVKQLLKADRNYGGIPSGGGYGFNADYEIGANLIGEAIHCILGCVNNYRAVQDWAIGVEHVLEEMHIIESAMQTYVTQPNQMNNYDSDKFESTKRSIIASSIKLQDIISQNTGRSLPTNQYLDILEKQCYDTLTILALCMLDSVTAQTAGNNAYADRRLINAVRKLRAAVDQANTELM